MENITKYEDSQNMTQFILKKINKIHGHFNKDYVMGFSLLENLSRGPVSARFNGFISYLKWATIFQRFTILSLILLFGFKRNNALKMEEIN